ncbi:MAG: ubiquinol-cytochrome c reductase iron-sulfur subunit [Gammaproteobacteria bacterium]|nr:ubiquinol-cytochrome c reductase iron-sulfur subunit [Gammaproteobacteria bacterium]
MSTSESDNEADLPEAKDRRHFLEKATCAVAGVGIVAAAWPFVSSMNPASNVLSKSTVEIDIGSIKTGEVKTVEWQSKPVFIFHRTPTQISAMQDSTGSEIDPQADDDRVLKPEWLVVIGLCTHLGCVPSKKQEGWFCPCHGSRYDNSGRILRSPAPKNLHLLPYQFLSADKLLLGKA